MGKFVDLSGYKFGDWIVLEYEGKSKWKCKCSCGNVKSVVAATLKNESSTNCGCRKIKHGYEGTKVYRLWSYMKERCESPKHKSYKSYGGKGIKVCDEWKEAKTFIEWCLNNGYKEGLTLDRIDYNGNYEPSNCRFITNLEQQRNKSNNRFLTIEGITKTVSEWGEIANLDRHTILYRINKGEEGVYVLRSARKGGGLSGADFKERFNTSS